MGDRTAGLVDRTLPGTRSISLYRSVAGITDSVFSQRYVILHLRGVC